MFNIIAIILIVICLAIIGVIIVKKLPFLANFDIGSIPEEKEADTKTKIMEDRLQRKTKQVMGKLQPVITKSTSTLTDKIKGFYENLKKLEEQYKKKTLKKEELSTQKEVDDFEKKIDKTLKEADDYIDEENFEDAEKKFIEIISQEPKNVEAYRGLGNLYFLQKNYEDAKQTFEHLLKLNQTDDMAYAKLGSIAIEEGDLARAKDIFKQSIDLQGKAVHYFELAEVNHKMEDYKEAINNLEKALELEPKNPKYLDLLITISIIDKKRLKAQKALNQLREINPDNQKIEEFEAEIKEM